MFTKYIYTAQKYNLKIQRQLNAATARGRHLVEVALRCGAHSHGEARESKVLRVADHLQK